MNTSKSFLRKVSGNAILSFVKVARCICMYCNRAEDCLLRKGWLRYFGKWKQALHSEMNRNLEQAGVRDSGVITSRQENVLMPKLEKPIGD